MLSLQTGATTGEKMYTLWTDAIHLPLKSTNYSSKSYWCVKIYHSRHRRQREGRENLELEEVIGSVTSATIGNFTILSCGVSPVGFEFSASLALHSC